MSNYKPIYLISTLGNCPKVLSAYRLKYKPTAPSKRVELASGEGKLHEEHIAQHLREEGLTLERAGECEKCKQLGYARKGVHLEWEFANFLITGHLDALVLEDKYSKYFPELAPNAPRKTEVPVCEIKTRSQSEFDRWLREGWAGFADNAFQLTTYMALNRIVSDNANKATINPEYYTKFDALCRGLKSFFVVKNRNTGEIRKSVQSGTPVKFTEILTKLDNIEYYVRRKELFPEKPNWGNPRCSDWCLFKYLCTIEDKGEVQNYLDSDEFTKYSKMWLDGTTMINTGKSKVEEAEAYLKGFAKSQSKDGTMRYSFSTGLIDITGYPANAYHRPASVFPAGWRCNITPVVKSSEVKPNE
jgi:hypothetical protein